MAPLPAFAQAGGSGGGGAAGGPSSATSSGVTGTSGVASQGGGGGGGAGSLGGNGGNGGGGAAGGLGATIAGGDGGIGANGTGDGGGGGGGGGAHGAIVTSTGSNSGTIAGGTGGDGGSGGTQGGGGGAGGYGVVINGVITYTNSATINGGNGGAGGAGTNGDSAGAGGDGGYGVVGTGDAPILSNNGTITGGNGGSSSGASAQGGNGAAGVSGTNMQINNSGSITGGNGGAGTGSNALNGTGGAGITGSGLNITNSGSITGGTAGDGTTQANAITFTSGVNFLTLQPGSTISGNVVATGTSAVLTLGGATNANANFDAGKIGTQYQGFGTFSENSAGTWTLTGTTTANPSWNVAAGTLSVSASGNLGTGSVTLQPGTTLAVTGSGTYGSTLIFGGGDPTVTIASGQTAVWTGQLTGGSSSLTLNGAGTLELTNNTNNWTQGTTLSSGTLVVGANNALGNGELDMQAGTTLSFASGNNFTVGNNIGVSGDPNFVVPAGTTQLLAGTISDNGSPGTVAVSGGGTIALTGPNTYSGGTTICATTCGVAGGNSSVVQVTNSTPGTSSSIGTGTLTFDGGTLQGDGSSLSFNNAVQLTGNGGIIDLNGVSLTFTGAVTGANGAGATALTVETSNAQGTPVLTLSGNNTYSNPTVVQSAILVAGSATGLSPNSAFQVNSGATLNLGGFSNTIASLADGSNGGGTVSNRGGAAAATLTILGGSGVSTSFSGTIEDGGTTLSLDKEGASTQVLSGANSFSGGTTVGGGTLVAANATALGTGAATVDSGATLNVDGVTINNLLTLAGTGVGGAGALTGTGTAGVSSAITLSGDASIGVANQGDTLTASGGIGGGFGLTKTGAGTLVLSGAVSTYTGPTTVSAGTLAIGAGGSIDTYTGIGNGFTGSSGVAIAAGATFDISAGGNQYIGDLTGAVGSNVNLGGNTLTIITPNSDTFGGVIQGTGGISKSGSNTLAFTQVQTYTGLTTISSGTLAVTGTGSIAASSGVDLSASGAQFDISDATGGTTIQSLTGVSGTAVILGGEALTVNLPSGAPVSFAGTIQDTGGIGAGSGGSLVKQGAGTLVLTGSNTYTGGTTVDAGTLQLASGGDLPSGGALTINGGTFDLNSQTQTVGALSGTGGTLALGSGGVLTAGDSSNTTLASTITGSGNLFKAGTGTLALAGNNTFAGHITVDDGTLSVASPANLGSASNGLTLAQGTTLAVTGSATFGNAIALGGLDPNIAVSAGQTATWSGVISQTSPGASLSTTGPGTLVLTNANTYSGGTNVMAGTLSVTNAAGLGTGAAAVSAGATLNISGVTIPNAVSLAGSGVGGAGALTGSGTAGVGGAITLTGDTTVGVANSGDTLTASNTISGAFALTKTGNGTLVLTGADGHTGSTTIAAGTLQVGNGGTGGSIAGTSGIGVASGALLVYDRSDSVTLAAPVSGAGGLTQMGGGVLTLTGANSYSGPTTVSGGTLQVGAGGTAGTLGSSSGVSVASGAALAFDRSDIIAYGGVVSGAGSLVQAGSGTVILTGTNTYSGATTVSSGTLQVGAGGTAGSLGTGAGATIAGGATLAFDRSDTVSYGGGLSGSGTLAQIGSGTLLLTGNSSGFAGSTTVGSGTLEVGNASNSNASASLGGNVTVDSGATLMGHGTIGGNVGNSGNVQPGGTVGVLTVGGNYSQASNGTLTIEITPNAAAGPGVGYSQLKVGGSATLNGTLAVVDDPGNYSVGTSYTVLTAAGGRSGSFATVTYDPVLAAYITPAVTYDANDVYLALDPTPSASPATTPAPLFNGGQQVPDALTAMLSAAEGVADTVLGDVCGPEAQRLVSPGQGCVVRPLAAGYQSEVWMRGLGGLGSLTGSGGRLSFDDNYGGALIGAGVSRGGFTLGAGGGYMATSLSFSDGSAATQDSVLGFVYGRYAQGPLWAGAMAAYGGGRVNGARDLAGTGLTASSSRPGDFAVVQGRVAYDLAVGPATVEPRASLAYLHAGQSGFAETGAGILDLTYPSTDTDTAEGRLTVRAMRRFPVGHWGISPWVEGGVQETFCGLSRTVLATDGTFSQGVAGVSPAPTAGLVGVGVDAAATDKLDLFLRYQGLFSSNQAENAFSAGVQVRF